MMRYFGKSRERLIATFVVCLTWIFFLQPSFAVVSAFSGSKPSLKSAQKRKRRNHPSTSQLLERCSTAREVLQQVGKKIDTESDPEGMLASLVLVRLSKLLVTLDNRQRYHRTLSQLDGDADDAINEFNWVLHEEQKAIWNRIVNTMSTALQKDSLLQQVNLEGMVEGTKAAAVISRIFPELCNVWEPLAESWAAQSLNVASELQAHQLSGLKWAYECWNLKGEKRNESCWKEFPQPIQEAYNELRLPFRIRPNCLNKIRNELTVPVLVNQVNFCVDDIRAASNRVVKERRQTAWEGDKGVANFEYSGKSMKTNAWSQAVRLARDKVHDITGVYYDGCLVNLYPDGGSGMRYHIDPDQGILWESETAVVSIGATRRFAFRPIVLAAKDENGNALPPTQPHTFTLMDGDVTEMFGDCQRRFQHTVKKAVDKREKLPRASLVFKKTFVASA